MAKLADEVLAAVIEIPALVASQLQGAPPLVVMACIADELSKLNGILLNCQTQFDKD